LIFVFYLPPSTFHKKYFATDYKTKYTDSCLKIKGRYKVVLPKNIVLEEIRIEKNVRIA